MNFGWDEDGITSVSVALQVFPSYDRLLVILMRYDCYLLEMTIRTGRNFNRTSQDDIMITSSIPRAFDMLL